MTSASMTFGRPTRLAAPRGSIWLAGIAATVISALRRLDQWQLSLQREAPQSAEDVLAWARRIEASEPGLASDLRAAALRAQESADR